MLEEDFHLSDCVRFQAHVGARRAVPKGSPYPMVARARHAVSLLQIFLSECRNGSIWDFRYSVFIPY